MTPEQIEELRRNKPHLFNTSKVPKPYQSAKYPKSRPVYEQFANRGAFVLAKLPEFLNLASDSGLRRHAEAYRVIIPTTDDKEQIKAATQKKSEQTKAFINILSKDQKCLAFSGHLIGVKEQAAQKRQSAFLGVLAGLHLNNVKPRDPAMEGATKFISRLLEKAYSEPIVTPKQQPLQRAIPAAIFDQLPENIVVTLGQNNDIEEINDELVNRAKTLLAKSQSMQTLVEKYNDVVTQVKADLKETNETLKMSAILTSIIMETGIRPGRPNQKAIKKSDGQPLEIDTFAATTLTKDHVKFVQNEAKFEFVGKRGKVNTAILKDQEVIQLLQQYVNQAQGLNAKPQVFQDKHGNLYRYETLRWYLKERLGGFSPSDFRRLRATQEVFYSLKQESQELASKIRAQKEKDRENYAQEAAKLIAETLKKSISKARGVLSHEPSSAAIYAYISQDMVFNYLINGPQRGDLKDAIKSAKGQKLVFDVDKFLTTVDAPTAPAAPPAARTTPAVPPAPPPTPIKVDNATAVKAAEAVVENIKPQTMEEEEDEEEQITYEVQEDDDEDDEDDEGLEALLNKMNPKEQRDLAQKFDEDEKINRIEVIQNLTESQKNEVFGKLTPGEKEEYKKLNHDDKEEFLRGKYTEKGLDGREYDGEAI